MAKGEYHRVVHRGKKWIGLRCPRQSCSSVFAVRVKDMKGRTRLLRGDGEPWSTMSCPICFYTARLPEELDLR